LLVIAEFRTPSGVAGGLRELWNHSPAARLLIARGIQRD
jgi:hypothetical protein